MVGFTFKIVIRNKTSFGIVRFALYQSLPMFWNIIMAQFVSDRKTNARRVVSGFNFWMKKQKLFDFRMEFDPPAEFVAIASTRQRSNFNFLLPSNIQNIERRSFDFKCLR